MVSPREEAPSPGRRRILLGAASCIAAACAALPAAADRPSPRERIQRLRNALGKLNLTAAQRSAADAAINDAVTALRRISNAPGSPEQKRPQKRAVMLQLRSRIFAILSPAQQARVQKALD